MATKAAKRNPTKLDRVQPQSAAGDNPHLLIALEALIENARNLSDAVAKISGKNPDTGASSAARTPVPARIAVSGKDGAFHVQITNPQDSIPPSASIRKAWTEQDRNQFARPLQHQIQSSDSVNFDRNVKTFGPTSQTELPIVNPNTKKYFRIRSSYDGQTWSAWAPFSNTAVQSGQASAATPTTTPNTPPSTGGGGSTAVNFADNETPTGACNGSNTAFTLAHTPNPLASLLLLHVLNQFEATLMIQGVHYTIAGTAITTVTPPNTGDSLVAFYRY